MQGITPFTYSSERYEGNILPTGSPLGTPEQALDRAPRLRPLPRRPARGLIEQRTDPRRINAAPH